MTSDSHTLSTWWGSFKFNNGQCRQWHIGPLTLIVRYTGCEWQVAYEQEDDFDGNDVSWESTESDRLPESFDNNSRYIFRETTEILTITPLLADRPIIARPLTPFNLTAGEEATLYVSSPLWLELSVGSAEKKILCEIAIQRLSDTWFGPSTREGKLCYASTTHCRLNLEELPHRPHRAITPIFIQNQADTTLSLERLNLPAPLLSIYFAESRQLWTPKVTLLREKDGDMAELNIDMKPPEEAQQSVQLIEPRKTNGSNALIRAFNAVFS